MSPDVSVTKEMAASPERVYALVADLPRMGEWSPENRGGEWLDAAAGVRPGTRFRGRNRNGRRAWKSLVTVVDADPGRRFAFRSSIGPVRISDWSYTFEALPTGCRVTESWTDLRPGWFRPIARIATGVKDRPPHNRRGMEQTLARLAVSAASDGELASDA
jgi:uncharacterized protein YndB with AHSA1/START domain